MPNPSKRLHEEVGLWSSSDIPTLIQYRILCHLASDPEARLYVKGGDPCSGYGATYVGVSNASGAPGWSTKGGMFNVLSGCHANKHKPWVTQDKAATKKSPQNMLVFSINAHGVEAIAQYAAYHCYKEESLALARKILTNSRILAKALRTP